VSGLSLVPRPAARTTAFFAVDIRFEASLTVRNALHPLHVLTLHAHSRLL